MNRPTEPVAAARVRLVSERGVARLTLTRGDKHNALDPLMLEQLLAALWSVEQDEQARILVIDAEGPAFCAGVDLRTPFFMESVDDPSAFAGMRLLDAQHRLITAVYRLPQLTVACVQGNAVGGGGFGLAMACDLRFAVRAARFWLVPAQLDVVQDFGLTWLLQRVIGPARTVELAFTGRRVDAEIGERWGFVNQAFANEAELRAHVEELASSVGGAGRDAARLLKHVIRNGAESSLEHQLKLEAVANGLCFSSEEFTQSKARFMRDVKGGGKR